MRHKIVLVSLILFQTACSTYYTSTDPYVVGVRSFDRKYFAFAKEKWEPLANAGECNSQYRMGTLYFLGTGVDKNYESAQKWFLKAADQGHAYSQHLLSIMYSHGYSEFRTENMIMAFNCVSGCGYNKDFVTAYQWGQLAERNTPFDSSRDRYKKYTERYKNQMSAEQIAKGDRYIETWKKTTVNCEQRPF